MKTAVQIALKVTMTEKSSLNAEVSNKISDVSNNLNILTDKVDGHHNDTANMEKKAQDAFEENKKIKWELNDVDLKLETLVINSKVPGDLNDGSEQSLLKP